MDVYPLFEPWWRFLIALLIGSLLGLEREYIQQKEEAPNFAGIRTFSLIALLGAFTGYLFENYGFLPFGFGFAALILLTAGGYVVGQLRGERGRGITTEVAALMAFILGASVFWVEIAVPAALAVVTTLLLSIKKDLHRAIRRLRGRDLRMALQFALISVVILPILPNQAVDPWGVINPFRIWLLVVFISGIGFVGYVLMKFLDTGASIWLTGLLGGTVSSTATTLNFAARSREAPQFALQFAQGILLASAMMAVRVLVVVAVLHVALLQVIWIPLAAMLVASAAAVYILFLRDRQSPEREDDAKQLRVGNPLRLWTALVFGLIFAVVLLVMEFANLYLGQAGVYAASFLTGLTDVNPIMLSMSEFASRQILVLKVAGVAIVIAALTNTLSKGVIAAVSGAREMRTAIITAFGIMLGAGAAALVAVVFLI